MILGSERFVADGCDAWRSRSPCQAQLPWDPMFGSISASFIWQGAGKCISLKSQVWPAWHELGMCTTLQLQFSIINEFHALFHSYATLLASWQGIGAHQTYPILMMRRKLNSMWICFMGRVYLHSASAVLVTVKSSAFGAPAGGTLLQAHRAYIFPKSGVQLSGP